PPLAAWEDVPGRERRRLQKSRQPPSAAVAGQLGKSLRRGYAQFPSAEVLHYFMVLAVNALAVLAAVREQGLFLSLPRGGDVHVGGRHETQRLAAAVDLEEIEGKPLARPKVGSQRQQTRRLVVRVRVDRPVRENDIRLFRGQQIEQGFRPLPVHFRGAVDLAGENCLGAEDLARGFGLGGADG